MLFFRRRLGLLISDMEDAAIAVFIDAIEPATAQGVIIKALMVFVVAKNPARAEAIANQRSGIFFVAGGYLDVEVRQAAILIQQVGWIKSRHITMRRIVKEQAREIVPVSIEDHFARRNVRPHPRCSFGVIVARVALANVFGGAIDIEE